MRCNAEKLLRDGTRKQWIDLPRFSEGQILSLMAGAPGGFPLCSARRRGFACAPRIKFEMLIPLHIAFVAHQAVACASRCAAEGEHINSDSLDLRVMRRRVLLAGLTAIGLEGGFMQLLHMKRVRRPRTWRRPPKSKQPQLWSP